MLLQLAFSDCLFLDLLSNLQDFRAASVIDICGCQVGETLVVTVVVVVIDKGTDLLYQVTRQLVVFQQDAVLHCLMPPLDFALGLRMVRRTPNVIHAFAIEIFGQVDRHVGRTVIAEQSWFVRDRCAVAARSIQRQFQRVTRPSFLNQWRTRSRHRPPSSSCRVSRR